MSTAMESPHNDVVAAAASFRDRGWHVFPIDHPALLDCASAHLATEGECPEPDKRGKHPVGHWPSIAASALPDKTLEFYFGRAPRNIGIACKPSGLLILDEDELGALEALAAELGEEIPETYRVRTYRGWHWYWLMPPEETIGNATGGLRRWHIDVRGNRGDGGYVVAAGSVHVSGTVYEAEDPWAHPAPLPDWIRQLILAGPTGPDGEPTERRAYDDEPRYGYRAQLLGQYQRHLAEVATPGFRFSLFNAARDAWRLEAVGVLDRFTLVGDLKGAVTRVWNAEPDDSDTTIVYTEARTAAQRSPWVLLDPPPAVEVSANGGLGLQRVAIAEHTSDLSVGEVEVPEASSPTVEPTVEQLDALAHQQALDLAVRNLRIRKQATRIVAAEDVPPIQVLSWRDFLAAEQPDYLVDRMLYRDSTAKVFGPPGTSKSFFLLDLALRLATGTPWRGRRLPRTRVHYVMAEGQAVNVSRTLAWLHGNEVDAAAGDGWFDAIPQGVLLTPEGVAGYLERVAVDRPGLVILDTKNAMMDGDENAASDVAVMVRAMRAIRDVSQACVVLVDHTGMTDLQRGRGSNAVSAAMDTEIRVSRDEDSGQLVAEVTRDKAAEPGSQWAYRLRTVEHVPGLRSGLAPPAMVDHEAPAYDTSTPFLSSARWHDLDAEPLPGEIATNTEKGAPAAKDVFRVLQFVEDPDGISRAKIEASLREGPRTHGASTLTAGLALAVKNGWVDKPSKGLYTLGEKYQKQDEVTSPLLPTGGVRAP